MVTSKHSMWVHELYHAAGMIVDLMKDLGSNTLTEEQKDEWQESLSAWRARYSQAHTKILEN